MGEKSVAQGRRVPKSLAVSRPKSQEILDILTYTGYKCVLLKDKLHPKDNYKSDPCNWGRVHLEFKGEDGEPILQAHIAKTKAQLLRFIGSKVPLLKSRVVAPPITKSSQPASTKTGAKTETKPELKPAPAAAKPKPRRKKRK